MNILLSGRPIRNDLLQWNVWPLHANNTFISTTCPSNCQCQESEPYIIVASSYFLLLLKQSLEWTYGMPEILNRQNISGAHSACCLLCGR